MFVKRKDTYVAADGKFKFVSGFVEITRESLYEVWYIKRSRACLQFLFESLFSLAKLLNMAMV
jgi:hypothetical protein